MHINAQNVKPKTPSCHVKYQLYADNIYTYTKTSVYNLHYNYNWCENYISHTDVSVHKINHIYKGA
jgi:hypothetical protein